MLSRRRRWFTRRVQLVVLDQSYPGSRFWYVKLQIGNEPSIVRQAESLPEAVRAVRERWKLLRRKGKR